MIDRILLAPYYCALKIRHFMYDKGLKKVHESPAPTISVGNVTVGGTGKTPHTEMLLRLLLANSRWSARNIAVLSRGYKRKSKGFQQVTADGTATEYGDEPMQIKRRFPDVTVAVDKDRIEGCDFLCNPEKLQTEKAARKCKDRNIRKADLIILDDAFQYRALKPDVSIVLVDYNRPVYEDHLLPAGRLRDLPERMSAADIVIITKCPAYLDEKEQDEITRKLRINSFSPETCSGISSRGTRQNIFFSRISYCPLEAVFPEGDTRYVYSRQAILVTGIADDTPMARFLSDSYKIPVRLSFPDHHAFTDADMKKLDKIARENPTAVFVTTEKDSQRFIDCRKISGTLRQRMFRLPITVDFLSAHEREIFSSCLNERL